MPATVRKSVEKPQDAASHCLLGAPYRMVVFAKINQHKIPLYLVAGSSMPASKAEKALREAHRLHGGACFYCKAEAKEITIDHVEATVSGGSESLQNLVIACKDCNAAKGHKPIEAFRLDAGRDWLQALLVQVQDRLNRLG